MNTTSNSNAILPSEISFFEFIKPIVLSALIASVLGTVAIAQLKTVKLPFPWHVSPVWQTTEVLNHNKGWTQSAFPVDRTGKIVQLHLNNRSKLHSVRVNFGNGQSEMLSLPNQTFEKGVYNLVNFGQKRYVKSIDVVARSRSQQSKILVDLQA